MYRIFNANLILVQMQLERACHTENFLRNLLTIAVETPLMKVALRERITHTAQQLANRIANRLLVNKNKGGSSMAHLTRFTDVEGLVRAMYIFEQN